jgi:HEAT repeat protein
MGDAATNALPDVADNLASTNFYIRQYAIVTLGDIGPAAQRYLPQLRELLESTNQWIRQAAAESITQIQKNPDGPTSASTVPDSRVTPAADAPGAPGEPVR